MSSLENVTYLRNLLLGCHWIGRRKGIRWACRNKSKYSLLWWSAYNHDVQRNTAVLDRVHRDNCIIIIISITKFSSVNGYEHCWCDRKRTVHIKPKLLGGMRNRAMRLNNCTWMGSLLLLLLLLFSLSSNPKTLETWWFNFKKLQLSQISSILSESFTDRIELRSVLLSLLNHEAYHETVFNVSWEEASIVNHGHRMS